MPPSTVLPGYPPDFLVLAVECRRAGNPKFMEGPPVRWNQVPELPGPGESW